MGSLPYNIRVNVNVPFPALVAGATGIGVTKQNGIWTIALNFSTFVQNPIIVDPGSTYVPVWDSLTGLYSAVLIGTLISAKTIQQLTSASSPYTAQPSDDVLLIENVPFTVNVDWSQRTKPLRVVDASGAASPTNPITITPASGQTQLSSLNYSYLIDGNGGSITLTPLPNQTGAY